jgi:hypothetical protein
MDDETKDLLKQISNLKDDVIVWKRSAEQHQRRAEVAESALAELRGDLKDQAIENDLADRS